MHCHDLNVSLAALPSIWDVDEDAEHVIAISNSLQDGVAQPASHEDFVQGAD